MHTGPCQPSTYPLRNVRPALLGNELQNTGVCVRLLRSVYELQHDGPLHVQLRDLVEG